MSANSYFVYSAHDGETLKDIAARFGCAEASLISMNSGASAVLSDGCRVRIPHAPGGCPNGAFYRLSAGETPTDAAARFGVTLKRLLEANPYLSPDCIAAGQVIIIPMPHFAADNSVFFYEFGTRDSLFDVLRRFQISIAELKNLNPGTDLFCLKPGFRLRVREAPLPTGAKTIVVPQNGSLVSVAALLGCDALSLLRLNPHLRPSDFCSGQRIRTP